MTRSGHRPFVVAGCFALLVTFLAVDGAGAGRAGGTYGILAPQPGSSQERVVAAADGTGIYTQTWLPSPVDGRVPPTHLPVVVVYTPYATPGVADAPELIDWLVPRGYAVTFANVRGTGASGGCFTLGGAEEVDDGARVIEDAGELAPWSSGVVGMYGASYPGGTQLAVATGPDRDRLESLDAIVVGAPSASLYDVFHHDGVPHFLSGPANVLVYLAALTSPTAELTHISDRVGCQLDNLAGTGGVSGDYTQYFQDRDHVKNIDRLDAATFMFHGTADRRVPSIMQAGMFDNIPDGVDRYGLFGVWGHRLPDVDDFADRVIAWFDRHLRGVDVASPWPVADIQTTDGRWLTVPEWPAVPGPRRAMLLGPDGVLDAVDPTGSTTYVEGPLPELEAPPLPGAVEPAAAIFETSPLAEPIDLVGTIELDLWTVLAATDSHITARLEVIDDAGTRIVSAARTMGARSAQHLDPLVGGRFRQASPDPAPVGVPVLVPIRFDPIALGAPAGSRLRLTVAGSSISYDGLDGVTVGLGAVFQGPTWPSGQIAPVVILHDENHLSQVRFTAGTTATTGIPTASRDRPLPLPDGDPRPAQTGQLPDTGGDSTARLGLALAAIGLVAVAIGRRSRLRPPAS